jgi:hypothetical protein
MVVSGNEVAGGLCCFGVVLMWLAGGVYVIGVNSFFALPALLMPCYPANFLLLRVGDGGMPLLCINVTNKRYLLQ